MHSSAFGAAAWICRRNRSRALRCSGFTVARYSSIDDQGTAIAASLQRLRRLQDSPDRARALLGARRHGRPLGSIAGEERVASAPWRRPPRTAQSGDMRITAIEYQAGPRSLLGATIAPITLITTPTSPSAIACFTGRPGASRAAT